MGGESNPNKPRYDITMSKRTRRAQSRLLFGEKVSALKDEEDKQVKEAVNTEEEKRRNRFIELLGEKNKEEECRSSLGEHFTQEDKQQLQLVVKHENGFDGMSLKKLVSRCAKTWGRMIKIKGGSRKKRVLSLTM